MSNSIPWVTKKYKTLRSVLTLGTFFSAKWTNGGITGNASPERVQKAGISNDKFDFNCIKWWILIF